MLLQAVCIRVGISLQILSQYTEIMLSFSISHRQSKAVSHFTKEN